MRREKHQTQWVCSLLLLTTLLFLPVCMHASMPADTRMSINVKSVPVTQVLDEIHRKSGLDIVYNSDMAKEWPRITINMTNKTAEEIIQKVTEAIGCTYEIRKNVVSITLVKSGKERTVKGYVRDENGDPLVGVPVCIGESRVCTVTDAKGFYTFKIPVEKTSLKFSYVGHNTEYVQIQKGDSEVTRDVVMREDNQIDEVVVTGYQVIDKRALTSAVTSVKAEDIMRADVLSIDQMLEGQVPDLMYMSNSGEAGVAPKIRIRGTSSIVGNREPLWVVDGIVVNDPVQISAEELNDPDYVNRIGNAIAGLNPQDIERLDILKDASATALYGTRAANGVIVITTKRGREGKPQIRYNNSFTMKIRPRYSDRSVDVMTSKERIQFSRELFASNYQYNSNISPVGYEGLLQQLYRGDINDQQFAEEVAVLESQNTDWFDLLTHDSFSQQHTISMNGGSSNGRYYASIGYTDNDDTVRGTTNDRYTALLNLDTSFAKWLSASFGLQGNVSRRDYYQASLSPVEHAYTASRAIPAFDENGEYAYYTRMTNVYNGYRYNILNELDNSGVEQNGESITLNANLRFKFTDWLTANAIASYTAQSTDIESYWGERTYYAARLRGAEYGESAPNDSQMPQGGELTTRHTRQRSYTVRLQLDWNKYFKEEKHNFSGSLGYEMSSTNNNSTANTVRGYFKNRGKSIASGIDLSRYTAYQGWVSTHVPTLTDDLSNTISGYLSMSYNYNRLIFLNLNGRIDGSNRFGDQANKKLLPIWSASASFNIKQLPMLQHLNWLDYATVKTSYGFQGNMLSTESPVMIIRKGSMSSYYEEFTSTTERNPNPNLKWEKTHSYNLGLELSFFHNRAQLEASLYFRRTLDAFMTKTISLINGMSTYLVNGGNISNNGYSVSLTLNPIMTKDWRWSLSTSFSRTINEITTTPAGEQYQLSNFLNGTAVVKGKSVGTFYSYRFLGLSPVDGGPVFDDYESRYEELSGLNMYDTYTRVLEASGTREPYMSGGLTTSLRYKNLRASANFAYSLGAKTRLFSLFSSGTYGSASVNNAGDIRPEWNVSRDYMQRWQRPGDELLTNIPAIIGRTSDSFDHYQYHWSSLQANADIQQIADSYWDMYDYSSIRVVSSDYLKLSSLSLTYEFPKRVIQPLKIERLELTASGQNLFTLCDPDLKGQTPTQGGFTTIQLSDRPSFSFGLSITF